jgi:putative sigma-54 modulation protein
MLQLKEKSIQRNTWPGRGGTKGGDHIEDHLDAEDPEAVLPTDGVATLPAEIMREKVLFLENKMSPEDACEQLENVGHDFYIFVDDKDGALKVSCWGGGRYMGCCTEL